MTINNALTADRANALATARAAINAMPLDRIDPSDAQHFVDDTIGIYFERLRREDPVHLGHSPIYGRYWSVTLYDDIMHVDTRHDLFSASVEYGGITLWDIPPADRRPSFIQMDPPEHAEQRKIVSPIVAPANLAKFESLIRERTQKVLEDLPRDATFNWVQKVSIELTSMMLATLVGVEIEDRKKLVWWSEVTTANKAIDPASLDPNQRNAELGKMFEYFSRVWQERLQQSPRNDVISMLAHGEVSGKWMPREIVGALMLLIVGGNDTTRNSMTGGLLALHEFPEQYAALRANPALIDSMVPEIIRWQTPIAHIRRTALRDTELGGKLIKKGDKVAMWYLSGNRDETVIENAGKFIIDRKRPRQHLSFGFGIHRCVGNRLAELQLKILWEEILERFPVIEVVGEPVRTRSPFVHGITHLPVRIPS
jgi:cytochrome P450